MDSTVDQERITRGTGKELLVVGAGPDKTLLDQLREELDKIDSPFLVLDSIPDEYAGQRLGNPPELKIIEELAMMNMGPAMFSPFLAGLSWNRRPGKKRLTKTNRYSDKNSRKRKAKRKMQKASRRANRS